MSANVACVAGATGLTGRYLVNVLAEDAFYERVVALARRPVEIDPALTAKIEERVVDFERLEAGDFAGVTHLFCALGTTIKKAGSREAFRRVDFEHVLKFARMGRAAGAGTMVVVSSVGADVRAPGFYLRVKGEMERELAEMGFKRLHIFRPGILLGARAESRRGEEMAARVMRAMEFLLAGPLRKYRPMPASLLAAAMAAAAERGADGVNVYHYDEIVRIAGF
jgi:uncharacterized protein YbjT (DUF2867 family)